MIRNNDGTPFQLNGNFSAFDPCAPIHDLLNQYDEEAIRIAGSPIYYYEVLIQSNTVDPLYNEDRGKLFNPVYAKLYAFYQPPDSQGFDSTLFGIDNLNEEVTFELNYKSTLTLLRHIPKVGSRIYTPHRGENWIIIDYRLSNFALWGATRLLLVCKKFQETVTNNGGQVTAINP